MTAARLAALALCVGLVTACQQTVEPPEGDPQSGPGFATAPDGSKIAYEVAGTDAEPALVFVHCWSCNRQFWREQVDAFTGSHRLVTLDLGGHGESSATRSAWSILELGADVKAVADHLGLDDMILVGHSMGGPVSLEAARLMPNRVRGLIAVDTLHDADLEYPPEMADQMVNVPIAH